LRIAGEMKRKKQLDSRAMMELAIEVMRQSVPEPRTDGKASPKVGAVLVKPDGTVETACRGELVYALYGLAAEETKIVEGGGSRE